MEGEVDEYYWRIDFKGKQPHPDEGILTNVTSVRDSKVHTRILKELQSFSKNIMKEGHENLLKRKEEIGYAIYKQLGLKNVFDKLWELPTKVDSIIMVTNSYDIPWDWAQPKNKEPIGERFIIGYVPLERIEQYKLEIPSEADNYWKDPQEVKSHAKIVLFGDECTEVSSYHIKELKDEMRKIKRLFMEKFDEKQIEELYGEEDSLHKELSDVFRNLQNVDIIHYTGHITKEGYIPSRSGRIEPSYLSDLCPDETRVIRDRGSLVFLNGCAAGRVTDIYEKTEQLVTVFMKHGARLCIAPRWPIPLYEATIFAETFYKVLLKSLDNDKEFGSQISTVIRETREMYPKEYSSKIEGYKNSSHLEELLLHLYFLYGNPAESVFWRSPSDRYPHIHETEEDIVSAFPDAKKILSR